MTGSVLEFSGEPMALAVFVILLGALWLGAAFSIARLLRAEADGGARRELWALTAWAFAVTAWRAPIPTHFFASVSATFPERITKIGLGWPTLTAMLSHLGPRTDWISFGAARLCGVLTAPIAYAALRRLSQDRRVALFGAGLLVALPFQIALATGDDAQPAALMLLLAGLSHFADYADNGRRLSFALAAPCLVLMVHTRLDTGFMLFAILVLVVQPRAFVALVRRDALMLATAGLATAVFTRVAIAPDIERCLPYPSPPEVLREALNAVTLFPAMGMHFTKEVTLLGDAPDPAATRFEEISWVPVVVLPLLWSGWGLTLFSGRGARLLVALLIARIPAYVSLNVGGTDYLGSRHFIGAFPLLCLVTATGAVALGQKLGRAAPLIAACGLALFVAEAQPPLRYRFAFQEEYAFLRRTITALPEGAAVAHIDFEFGLSPWESSLRLLRPDILWIDFANLSSQTTRFAYLGPDCAALQDISIEQATQQYLDRADRIAMLTNLRNRCQLFVRLPARRVLAQESVSRHGHGPSIGIGPRLPVRLVELAPPSDASPAHE